MELWIRSQDKTKFKKINEIVLSVAGGNIFCNKEIFGEYETRKRALEILDEIQKILTPKIMLKYNDDFTMSVSSIELQPATYVYEMPEE